MLVKVDFSSLRRTRGNEYVTRFLFGGAVTVLAGLIAKRFGPGVGGLFLAFPAIFPASASLIQKHEMKKKLRAGQDGTKRGRVAAGIDAFGASIGCLALGAFAMVTWKLLPRIPTAVTLALATMTWVATAVTVWIVRKRVR
jgi:hypothetical protein